MASNNGKRVHIFFGPVQEFVSEARRTRDLWVGSWLLSYLAGQAMHCLLYTSP
ncbi:MAG: hypothetical protein N2512_03250, partial [Armatimonadetes bacterium]|nr:hypothetical protein [Armatimonadota bacterium]